MMFYVFTFLLCAFSSLNFVDWMQQSLLPCALFVNFSFYFLDDKDRPMTSHVMFVNAAWVLRALVISIKYGLLPSSYFLLTSQEFISNTLMLREQIVAGWVYPDLLMIERELDLAAQTYGLNLDRTYVMHVCPTVRKHMLDCITKAREETYEAFGGSADTDKLPPALRSILLQTIRAGLYGLPPENNCPDAAAGDREERDSELLEGYAPLLRGIEPAGIPEGAMTAKKVLTALVVQSRIVPITAIGWATRIGAILLSLSPSLVRLARGDSLLGDTPLAVLVCVCAMWCSYAGLITIIAFQLTSLVDFHRRYACLRSLTNLISPAGLDVNVRPGQRYHEHGYLCLRIQQNSSAYPWMRKVLTGMGLRFHWRSQLYASLFLTCSAVSFVGYLAYGLQNPDDVEVPALVIGAVFTLILILLTTLISLLGALANRQYIHDCAVFRHEMLDISRELLGADDASLDKAEVKKLKRTLLFLEQAVRVMKSDAEVNPVRLMGFKCTFALSRTIIAAVGASLAFFARLLFIA